MIELEKANLDVAINGVTGDLSREKFLYEITKRVLDIMMCLVFFPICIILTTIFAIAIKLESKGPIFYTQDRLGKNGKKFKLYKLRSMKVDAEKNGAQWTEINDPRTTKVGKFIRLTRIDEMPQFWNIFKGDMSLVGPRPEREVFYDKFEEQGIRYRRRLVITPGLTGFAQVNGGYNMSPKEKLKWDMEYIKKRNLLIDFKIILKTVRIIFTGEGAR